MTTVWDVMPVLLWLIYSIPGLDLKYLKETEDYVYKPIEIADYPLHSGRDSARTDVR